MNFLKNYPTQKRGAVVAQRDCKRAERRGHGAAALLAIFLLIFLGCLGGRESQAAPASGVAGAALILADASNEQVGLWVVVAALIISALSGLVSIVVAFRPQPALHKQFADKEDTDKKIDSFKTESGKSFDELEKGQKAIIEKLETHNTSQYDARRRMHRTINSHSNALNYLAGQLDAKGDPNGKRIRDILRQNPEGQESE